MCWENETIFKNATKYTKIIIITPKVRKPELYKLLQLQYTIDSSKGQSVTETALNLLY